MIKLNHSELSLLEELNTINGGCIDSLRASNVFSLKAYYNARDVNKARIFYLLGDAIYIPGVK